MSLFPGNWYKIVPYNINEVKSVESSELDTDRISVTADLLTFSKDRREFVQQYNNYL
jgi:hypothetical protein